MMKGLEETHECPVCGHEHTHSVKRYTFDLVGRELGSERTKGPVTFVVDEFGDVTVEVDDGYAVTGKHWDQMASVYLVDVVRTETH